MYLNQVNLKITEEDCVKTHLVVPEPLGRVLDTKMA